MRKTTDPKKIQHLINIHEAACVFYEEKINFHQERIEFLNGYLSNIKKPGFKPKGLSKIGKK